MHIIYVQSSGDRRGEVEVVVSKPISICPREDTAELRLEEKGVLIGITVLPPEQWHYKRTPIRLTDAYTVQVSLFESGSII